MSQSDDFLLLGNQEAAARQEAEAAAARQKRPRSTDQQSDDAGPSGVAKDHGPTASTPTYYFSNVFKDLSDQAMEQVQPAVSEAIKLVTANNSATAQLLRLQLHKEKRTLPAFIRNIAQQLQLEGYDQEAQDKVDGLYRQYLDDLLDTVLAAAGRKAAAAAAAAAGAEAAGHPILEAAFSSIPAAWKHRQEVQDIKAQQMLKYQWEFSAAETNVNSKHKKEAEKLQKKQAAADAMQTEAAPVTLQQQVEQLAQGPTALQLRTLQQTVVEQKQQLEAVDAKLRQLTELQKQQQSAGRNKPKPKKARKGKSKDATANGLQPQQQPKQSTYLDAAKAGKQQQQHKQPAPKVKNGSSGGSSSNSTAAAQAAA